MPAPPPELTSWTSLVKDVVTGGAAAVGAVVAVRGLSAWRKQLKGKTDYDLARRLLKASYKVRDAIRFVRRPAIRTGEAAAAKKEIAIVDDRLRENPNAAIDFAVYQVRWNKLADAIAEFEGEAFEAEISWGTSSRARLLELLKVAATLGRTIHQHIETMLDNSTGSSLSEIGDILYDTSEPSKPDDFTQKVQTVIKDIEEFLRPHLGPR